MGLSPSVCRWSSDIDRLEALQGLRFASDGSGPKAADGFVSKLAARYDVPAPEVAFGIDGAVVRRYEGFYAFYENPKLLVVMQHGTNAEVLAHEFAHHLQWLSPARGLIPKDSLGRLLWHKPTVFVPLLDEVAAAAAEILRVP